MPDYFVPLDTLQFTRFHRMLNAKSIIINANLRYVDNNRKTLKNRYKTFDDFNTRFTVPQSQIDAILKEGEAQQIKPKDQAELKRTLSLLRIQLKALVARDLWDMDEYFQIMNETNHVVRKALEVLSH